MQYVTNVLHAFTKRNPEIGYLQGFNFIVDFFWKKGFDQESSFWLLCHLAEELVLFEFYKDMTPLFADIKMFKYFLFNRDKKLFKALIQNNIDVFFAIHKWFLVNFLNLENVSVSYLTVSCPPGSLIYF